MGSPIKQITGVKIADKNGTDVAAMFMASEEHRAVVRDGKPRYFPLPALQAPKPPKRIFVETKRKGRDDYKMVDGKRVKRDHEAEAAARARQQEEERVQRALDNLEGDAPAANGNGQASEEGGA